MVVLPYNTVMSITRNEKPTVVPKVEVIRELLRSHIISGRYLPGHRLPTFVEMEGEFDVGRAVIQQALGSLKREGFIRSVNRQGLYVVSNPPHLFQYGIVMAATPGEPGWNQLMTALSNEAHRIEKSDPQTHFRFYYNITDKESCNAVVAKLREDIKSQCLAGLILTPKTFHLLDHPVLAQQPVPRVYLWAMENSGLAPRVGTDSKQLISRALHFLKEQGRQRIAIVHMADTTTDINHKALYAEAGLDFHLPWIQRIGRSHPEFAQDVTSLLMDYRFENRPDGLIIADDNLVDPVSRGLVTTGIKVGQELEIVAHCNWPWPAQSVLPMTRIGFNIGEILDSAMAAIALQRQDQIPPTSQRVRALFEHEVPAKPVPSVV